MPAYIGRGCCCVEGENVPCCFPDGTCMNVPAGEGDGDAKWSICRELGGFKPLNPPESFPRDCADGVICSSGICPPSVVVEYNGIHWCAGSCYARGGSVGCLIDGVMVPGGCFQCPGNPGPGPYVKVLTGSITALPPSGRIPLIASQGGLCCYAMVAGPDYFERVAEGGSCNDPLEGCSEVVGSNPPSACRLCGGYEIGNIGIFKIGTASTLVQLGVGAQNTTAAVQLKSGVQRDETVCCADSPATLVTKVLSVDGLAYNTSSGLPTPLFMGGAPIVHRQNIGIGCGNIRDNFGMCFSGNTTFRLGYDVGATVTVRI